MTPSRSATALLSNFLKMATSVSGNVASERVSWRPILVVFDSVRRHQYGSAFVFHEEHDELSRFSLARVPPNDVNIRGTFIEGLTGCQSHFLPAPHLHHDRAFQHINEPMCIVAMDWIRAARRILHSDHHTFLARKLRQVFRQERRHLCLFSLQRAGHKTYQYHHQFCNRHKQTFRVNWTTK